MKKVLDGKVYDTRTADCICQLPSTFDRSDFRWHSTALYRTSKGRFFVAGEGGPRSMWAQPYGNNGWQTGKGLRQVTEKEARDYMEAAGCSEDEFIEAGLPIEEA